MLATFTGHHCPPGQTSGSPERAPQQLVGPLLAFDLGVEAAQLRYEHGWRDGEQSANTLVHEPDLRVVLIALRRGARIREHRTAGRITVQVTAGRARLHCPDQTVELSAGHLLALEPGIPHDVEALEDSALLLTIVWRNGRPDA
ncbi:MAG TPA: cupin domain-containing protein [Chloroflexota bacterium]|nr:cupin domain-containing protein [Chloroflexota bacterium]